MNQTTKSVKLWKPLMILHVIAATNRYAHILICMFVSVSMNVCAHRYVCICMYLCIHRAVGLKLFLFRGLYYICL